MAITTLSSRQFNQDASKANEAAKAGAYALDFSRESETLTLDNTVLWQKKEEAIET